MRISVAVSRGTWLVVWLLAVRDRGGAVGSRRYGLGVFEQVVDDLGDADGFGFGAVGDEDAVAQDGRGEALDVVEGDVGSSAEERARLRSEDEELGGAQAGAPVDVLVDEVGGAVAVRAGAGGEADGVADEVLGHRGPCARCGGTAAAPRRSKIGWIVSAPAPVVWVTTLTSSSSGEVVDARR